MIETIIIGYILSCIEKRPMWVDMVFVVKVVWELAKIVIPFSNGFIDGLEKQSMENMDEQ